MTSTQQFLVFLLIFAVFIMLIGTMLHRTYSYSANLTQCAAMFFGDDWKGAFNNTLAKWCNNNLEWQEVISRY